MNLSKKTETKIIQLISSETIYSPKDIKDALLVVNWDIVSLMIAVEFSVCLNMDLISMCSKANDIKKIMEVQ